MSECGKKILRVTLEVVALAILTIAAYWGSMMLIFGAPVRIMGVYVEYIWDSKISLIVVLIFDIVWLATIKFWSLKNIHIKIVLTLLVLAFSAAFITSYITAYMLRDFHW